MNGSVINQELQDAARNFVNEVVTKIGASLAGRQLIAKIEEDIFENELYSQFHECHLRVIHWHLAFLIFKLAQSDEGLQRKDDKDVFSSLNNDRMWIPGGIGQIAHGLAYGIQDSTYSLDIHCGRRIEAVHENESGKIEISCGESKFCGDYAVC